ncbi:MAG TPA: serine/threonine-protein kinase [Kofleriaceae bacterium]|jgi:tetratricopeptide (TPR) repeat protein/predicted Ser/Thr protein kinase
MPNQPEEDDTVDGKASPTAETIDAPSDSFDEILAKVVRAPGSAARGEMPELAIGAELLGRFKITSVLGAGGMGTVYVARDVTLGREVAIKIHHSEGGAARLRREAMAMAKLAHPNVVTVFEVGELERRPFVVMEYVQGANLRDWLRAAPRTVREICERWIEAGEGLAAAHGAGLVHRDIKPENVLLGDDGRPRVGDFGLARELDSIEEVLPMAEPSASQSLLSSPMTQTGAVLGTPAYMAPEQFGGVQVDARADQFAFCVALWEGLWGERPFAGQTFQELHAAITSGTRRDPPAKPKVPTRIKSALERGLDPDPGKRFADMHDLLDALRAGMPHTRGYWAIAGGGMLGVATAAFLIARSGGGISCDDAGALELARVPRDLPAKLRAVGGNDAATRAEKVLTQYEATFRANAQAACKAGKARHDWSPALMEKSDACFAIAARAASEELTEATQPLDLVRVTRAVMSLPRTDRCASPMGLETTRPLPADPTARETLIEARALVLVNLASGASRPRPDALEKLKASSAASDPQIAAAIQLFEGETLSDQGKVTDGEKKLADAYYAARSIDDDELVTQSLTALLFSTSVERKDIRATEAWLRTAQADADRLASRSPELAGRLYLNVGRASDEAEEVKQALAQLAHARELMPPDDPDRDEVDLVEGGLKIYAGKVDEGRKEYEAAVAATIARLGPDDLTVASQLGDYAAVLLHIGADKDALEVAQRAAKIVARAGGNHSSLIDAIELNLGAVLVQEDRDEDAQPILEHARADYLAGTGANSAAVATIDSDLAIIHSDHKEYAESIALLEEALRITDSLGPGRVDSADIYYNIAATKRTAGDYVGANEAAHKDLAIYRERAPDTERCYMAAVMTASTENSLNHPTEALAILDEAAKIHRPGSDGPDQNLAWWQVERAHALITLHRAAEARTLLDSARQIYAVLKFQPRLDEIDDLAKQL